MKRLEDELRNAMRREKPPEGFADRVIAASAASRENAWTRFFAGHGPRWALAGAMCLVLMAAGIQYHRERQERARGEAAKTQLMLALRITADKLQFAQAKVQQHGGPWLY